MRAVFYALLLVAACAAAGLYLTRPTALSERDIAGIEPDLERGAYVFAAGGCASCHAAPGAEGEDKLNLAGGYRLETPFGTFVAPNISQDPDHGIGGWSRAEIVTALMKGTSPEGRHYYPAFPYAAYAKADLSDMVSLAAYLETLPAVSTPNQPHELSFPATIRAGVGAWKLANLSQDWAVAVDEANPALVKGRYIAEALAHCGECHTPRNVTQGLDPTRWFAGAPNPSGRGNIPNITPAELSWDHFDLTAYLETGFTPDFDSAGGTMASVVEELGKLPKEDLEALASYVQAVQPSE